MTPDLKRQFFPLFLTLTTCGLLLAITAPADYGDAPIYVSDILSHHVGSSTQRLDPLWEFGHVLWRPLGYVSWIHVRDFLTDYVDMPHLSVAFALAALNAVFSLAAAPLFYLIAKITAPNVWYACLLAVSFFCTNGVLNHAKTGSAYVPGLAMLLLALLCTHQGCNANRVRPWAFVGAGVAVAGSVALWFPFVLAVPGLVTATLLWTPKRREAVRNAVVILVCSGALLTVVYAVAVWQAGVGSVSEAYTWYASARHGMKPYNGVVRLATGLPRGFFDLGYDGLILKRLYLRDPYAPVSILDLFSLSWWKLAVFYGWAAFLLRSLFKCPQCRRYGILLVAGWVPTLLFAAVLFDPSSRERFVPAFPFLILAIGAVLKLHLSRRQTRFVVVVPLMLIAAVNIVALRSTRADDAYAHDIRRIEVLKNHMAPRSRAVIISLRDGINRFQSEYPFHRVNQTKPIAVYYAVQIGHGSAARWQENLSTDILKAWAQGGEFWVSKRVFAQTPRPEWLWAEGEDPHVRWVDLPVFFARLEQDRLIGDKDGFFRIARSDANRMLFESLCCRVGLK